MITKNTLFVIFLVLLSFVASACDLHHFGRPTVERTDEEVSGFYGDPKVLGNLRSNRVTESSGLAITECNPDVFWTINDSGNPAEIHAFTHAGRPLSVWKVTGATNRDWEALASSKDEDGNCYLHIGEIGDNEKKHKELKIYRIQEPNPKGRTGRTEEAKVTVFTYADGKQDSEAMFVHPQSGETYIFSKDLSADAAGVYKIINGKAVKIASVSLPSIPKAAITGASISKDGRRVILCDYLGAYELTLPEDAERFDAIWTQKPLFVDVGVREQGEAIAYTTRTSGVLVTSEKLNTPINYVEREK